MNKDSVTNKTALVTGASVGIGRATAVALAGAGYDLVLLARRNDKLQEVAAELSRVKTHLMVCDINDHDLLTKQLTELPEHFQNIDLLVNNAGLALGLETADQTDWNDWQTMIETNCLSLAFLTRKVLPNMVERNTGHIVNIGSTAGSYAYKGGNVYGATKAFVEQFTNNLRTDLLGKQIKVTHVAPGLLSDTEFSMVRFHGNKEAANAVYDGVQALNPEDIAQTIQWIVMQPDHVNVNTIEVMPLCQGPAGLAVIR